MTGAWYFNAQTRIIKDDHPPTHLVPHSPIPKCACIHTRSSKCPVMPRRGNSNYRNGQRAEPESASGGHRQGTRWMGRIYPRLLASTCRNLLRHCRPRLPLLQSNERQKPGCRKDAHVVHVRGRGGQQPQALRTHPRSHWVKVNACRLNWVVVRMDVGRTGWQWECM